MQCVYECVRWKIERVRPVRINAAPRADQANPHITHFACRAIHVELFSNVFNMFLQFLSLLLVHETLSTSGRLQKSQQPNILPMNHLVTATLKKGEAQLFCFLDSEQEMHPLSVTVTPCSASVQWSLLYKKDPGIVNATEILLSAQAGGPGTYRGSDLHTLRVTEALPGLYLVPMLAIDEPTTVQIFASMDPGGPHDLVHLQDPGLKLSTLRKRKLSVRWNPSLVNPQNMHYCLVVSSAHPYTKLCEAQEAVNAATISSNGTDDVTVACVKHKTHVVLSRLQKGKTYKVWLFATNIHTRLTVPYGNASVVLAARVVPEILRDGKPKAVSIRKHDGHVNFRFRVVESGKDVHMYLVSCGGAVNAQLMHRRRVLVSRKRVHGYARFKVPRPRKGDYYSLKVNAADADELGRIRSVEALATQYRSRFPLPELPPLPEVHEYASLRRCAQVTVGWVPAPGAPARYCVVARKSPPHALHAPPSALPEQCGLDTRLRRSSYVARDCAILATDNAASVTTHNVTNLIPGTSYSIQVTVKKLNGRTLSYKILNVYTKHTCD